MAAQALIPVCDNCGELKLWEIESRGTFIDPSIWCKKCGLRITKCNSKPIDLSRTGKEG